MEPDKGIEVNTVSYSVNFFYKSSFFYVINYLFSQNL